MDTDPSNSASPPPSDDDLTAALTHERRRRLLILLHDHGTPLGLADAADELAEQEYAVPLPQISAEDVKRIYMSLYHIHVPTLADVNLVRYNQDRDLVAASEYTERAVTLMDVTSAHDV